MHIIWTIVIGFFIGLVARFAMPGRDPMGFIWTTLLGIGGALTGGYLGRALGFYDPNQPAGFIMAVLGALLLLGIYHFASRHTTHHT